MYLGEPTDICGFHAVDGSNWISISVHLSFPGNLAVPYRVVNSLLGSQRLAQCKFYLNSSCMVLRRQVKRVFALISRVDYDSLN